ncbi:hypothetical protein [Streptomyces atratus]|uniref:hypothetical protein n=1 Tax=Streptomyces atratus TaxID=1893 RepID=UPI00225640E3|nr:hypothetical protein [Streptomyces atratus]MCX5345561.1 hypothetical protein [Streptomyces atratus]
MKPPLRRTLRLTTPALVLCTALGTLVAPTDFLGSGTWRAEIVTDGPDGGLVRTRKTIRAGATLSVSAVANGGHAVKLTRVAP